MRTVDLPLFDGSNRIIQFIRNRLGSLLVKHHREQLAPDVDRPLPAHPPIGLHVSFDLDVTPRRVRLNPALAER